MSRKPFFNSSSQAVHVPGNKVIMFRHFYLFFASIVSSLLYLASLDFSDKIDIKLFRLEYRV